MLDLGTHTRFAPVGFFVRLGQGPIPVGSLVGEVFGSRRDVLEPLALFVAPVGTVAVEAGLPAMQQVGQLLAVMYVAGGNARAVDQAAVAVHADVQLHAKVPLVALLALVHLRIALPRCVLGRGRGRDQCRIDNRAPGELHAVGLERLADCGEQSCADLVFFKKMAKLKI